MTNQSSGEIYLIRSDFKFHGVDYPNSGEFKLIATKLQNCIVDENMVKFDMVQYVSDDEELCYSINLIRKDVGTLYSGEAKLKSFPDHIAEIKCQVYKNIEGKDYAIIGNWDEIEDDENNKGYYTFIARIRF